MLSANGASTGRSKIIQLDDSKLVVREWKNGNWSNKTTVYERVE
ncbi:MAG: hypothetical protein ACE5IR_22775 [bacterium]